MATREQLIKALRAAHEAGDTEGAQRIAAMVAAQPAQAAVETPSLMSRIGSGIKENVIGSGEVDTPGEYIGQGINAMGSGVVRGIEGLLTAPSSIRGLVSKGAEKVGVLPDGITDTMRSSDPLSGQSLSAEFSNATGGMFQRPENESRLQKYAGTVGEFLPGAIAFGGMSPANIAKFGIAPALASEAAGQATEGTAVEPYARLAAGLLAPVAASKVSQFTRGGDEMAAMANTLKSQGVTPTAGQASGSTAIRRLEGRLEPSSAQLDDFTSATMRQIGSTAPKATPEALRAAGDAIVKQMDDAVAGVSVIPRGSDASHAARLAADYIERVPAGQLTPRVRGIATEIERAATSRTAAPIELSRLKTWRSDIGKLTVSPDAATREAAHGLRSIIDDMTDTALRAAGREADIAGLSAAREAYRNFIGVRDAASRAGAEAGLLSPAALNQSMIRATGREAYATGRGTDMADFTRAGAAVLRPVSAVSAGGIRSQMGAANLGAGGLGALAGSPMGLPGAIAGGLLGAAVPPIGQALMRSAPVQTLLADPAQIMRNVTKSSSGLLAQ